MNIKQLAPNLKIRIGSKTILRKKIMKEVKLKRYAGPFEQVPFKDFVQSPVGLVPKDNGKDTRLIFHLSHPRNGSTVSINAGTAKHLCSVKYPDFAEAIWMCIEAGDSCTIAKSDMTSAFRNLCMKRSSWPFSVLKAR